MLPLVASNNEPAELLEPALATFTLKTTLPFEVEANTAMLPVVLELENVVLALPLALVVAVELETEPPLVVETEKFTVMPETGAPLELVAMISRGIDAVELGAID